MSDRVPIVTIPGLLSGFLNTDLLVLPAGSIGSAVTFFVGVTDAPSGGTVVAELRNATGGGGDALSCTIADGAFTQVATGTIALTGTEALYLRLTTTGGSAMNLSGWFELSATAGGAVLTSLALVKAHGNIDVSTFDALLTTLIAGVSTAMQKYIGFDLVQTAYTTELTSAIPGQRKLYVSQRPVLASPPPVLYDQGAVIDATTYTLLPDEGAFVAMTASAPGAWGYGTYRYSADYSAGYATIPDDLSLAATKQVRHEFRQTAEGGNRLSSLAVANDAGGSVAYVPGGWLPEVEQVMDRYARFA